jgi:YHS domain-containing protein
MTAQNPSGKYTPVERRGRGRRGARDAQGRRRGRLFHREQVPPGPAQFSSRYEDVSFRFASAEHKALFDKQPTRYLPEFGGYCANGIAYGIPWGGDADTWKMIDGKLYIFGGQASKDGFELDEKKNLALAEAYWKDEVAGNNSFVQRWKRLIFRVPHYQSGEALAKAVAEARAKGGAAK